MVVVFGIGLGMVAGFEWFMALNLEMEAGFEWLSQDLKRLESGSSNSSGVDIEWDRGMSDGKFIGFRLGSLKRIMM